MKTLTLFNSYRRAETGKQWCIELRGGEGSIAVTDDDYAKRWQRLDRLQSRIIARFHGIPVCPICAGWRGKHRPDCRRLLPESGG